MRISSFKRKDTCMISLSQHGAFQTTCHSDLRNLFIEGSDQRQRLREQISAFESMQL
jgi:hypothetical protein